MKRPPGFIYALFMFFTTDGERFMHFFTFHIFCFLPKSGLLSFKQKKINSAAG